VIFSDELNHASIIDGARLARAPVRIYRHADVDHLSSLLAEHAGARRALVVTDSVFSMDGDLAPLPELVEVCERAGAMLMVDEAHATGVVGPGGRGAVAHFGLTGRVPIVMSTLSKALGAAGGAIAGSRSLIAFLRNRARSFVFDTAPPAPVAAAALTALEIVRAEPWRAERARSLATRLADGLRAHGFQTNPPPAAIIPIVVGGADAAISLAASLRDAGYLVPAIRPPTVPEGTARLRATTMATHTDEQVDGFVATLARAAVPA
jgi:glycine C-acetyltransferase/8-amino-7-oxononanoate synthase